MESYYIKVSQQILGYSPREEQLAALFSYINGNDTIFIAPTGFGKSFLYHIAPFAFDQGRYSNSTSGSTTTTTTAPTVNPIDTAVDESASPNSTVGVHLQSSGCQSTSTPLSPNTSFRFDMQSLMDNESELDLELSTLVADVSLTHAHAAHKEYNKTTAMKKKVCLLKCKFDCCRLLILKLLGLRVGNYTTLKPTFN